MKTTGLSFAEVARFLKHSKSGKSVNEPYSLVKDSTWYNIVDGSGVTIGQAFAEEIEGIMNDYDKHIPKGSSVILRAVVGSTVHGTSISDQADRDEMGIVIEPMRHVIGMQHWESSIVRTQPDGVRSQAGDLDLTLHSLRKFCRLSVKGNPSLLIALFVPADALVFVDQLGNELRQKRGMFLSKDAGGTFLGYMHAQRNRMTGESGSRHGAPRPELIDKYGFDTKYAGHIVRLGLQGIELMETGHMSLPMKSEHRDEVIAVRMGQVPFNDVVTRAGILERDLRDAIAGSFLPQHADVEAIDSFLSDAYCRSWGALWHKIEPSPYEISQNAILGAL